MVSHRVQCAIVVVLFSLLLPLLEIHAAFESPQTAGQIVGRVINSCRPDDASGISVYIRKTAAAADACSTLEGSLIIWAQPFERFDAKIKELLPSEQ